MRISDWSSDVCSSDLIAFPARRVLPRAGDMLRCLSGIEDVFDPTTQPARRLGNIEIGRATGRERGWQYVSISVVAGSVKQKKKIQYIIVYSIHIYTLTITKTNVLD